MWTCGQTLNVWYSDLLLARPTVFQTGFQQSLLSLLALSENFSIDYLKQTKQNIAKLPWHYNFDLMVMVIVMDKVFKC